MRPALILGLIVVLAQTATIPAWADNPPLGGAMAKCSPKDPPVIVNTSKMTYMLDTMQSRSAMRGMMTHDKFVCRSAAMKMGAKERKGAPMMMQTSGKM